MIGKQHIFFIGVYCKKIERGHMCPTGPTSQQNERRQECPSGQMNMFLIISKLINCK